MSTEQEVITALERCNAAVVEILRYVRATPPWQSTVDSLTVNANSETIERTYHTPEWEVSNHIRIRNGKVQHVRAFTSHRHQLTQ